MVTTEKLLNSQNNKKMGNHRKEINGNVEKYFYYATCIYEIDHDKKTITVDNGGYGTQSTTRAINSYLKNDYYSSRYTIKDLR